MIVRKLISELVKCDMDAIVYIEVKKPSDLDCSKIDEKAHSVINNIEEVVISSEWNKTVN